MKLWARLGRAIQDGRVMVERSDRMWSTGEGNDKPLQYSWEPHEQYEKKRLGPCKANVVKFIKGWEMFILIKSVPALSCTEGFSNQTDVCNPICSSSHYFYEISGTDLNTSISWWETRHWDTKTPVWIHIFSHTRAKLDLQQGFLTPSQKCHPSHLFSP